MQDFGQYFPYFLKFKMQTKELISALFDYFPEGEIDNQYRIDTISHIKKYPSSWWQRSTLEGHVTASAWVLNLQKTHALFLHHAKLNRWLQPGGHLDDMDFSPAHGALREALEETGITNLAFDKLLGDHIFDVDVHPIPARDAEPAHLHYDLRYLVVLPNETPSTEVSISAESLGFRWISLEVVEKQFETSLARMAQKTLQIMKNVSKSTI